MNVIVIGNTYCGKSTLVGKLYYESKSRPEIDLDVTLSSDKRLFANIHYSVCQMYQQRTGSKLCPFHVDSLAPFPIRFIAPDSFTDALIAMERYPDAMIVYMISAESGEFETSIAKYSDCRKFFDCATMYDKKEWLVVISKMDTVEYKSERYEEIRQEMQLFAKRKGFILKGFVPIAIDFSTKVSL